MIIRGIRNLEENYHRLKSGDIYIGRIHSGPLRQAYLVDLLERGVHCLPSPLAQTLNNSKAAQAAVLKDWMLPLTRVLRRRHDLVSAIGEYARNNIGAVVTKADHMHCGHGVRRWDCLETVYNTEAFSASAYPMVVQPYLESYTDVRVIMAGPYREAYRRTNPNMFRMNMASGAESAPFRISRQLERCCFSAMARGRFPYAHIDLQILEDGKICLSEISLDGGVKGAEIRQETLVRIKADILEGLASDFAATRQRP